MGETATLTPDQQHLRALREANRVRLARADMKRKIAAGQLSAADVILTCPWQAHSMSISDLLMSQKRWGLARCRRLLTTIAVPENKAVGTLTERQRVALAAMLTAKGAVPERRPLRPIAAAEISGVGLDARPRGRQLDDVPVWVAQVDRVEERPVHHLRAGDALRREVLAPALQLLPVAHGEGEVVG